MDVVLGVLLSRVFVVRNRAGVSRKMGAVCRDSIASRAVWNGAHRQAAKRNVRVVPWRCDLGNGGVATEVVARAFSDTRDSASCLGDFGVANVTNPER